MARFELQKLYIDGGYTDASSDATFDAINPANGEVLAQVQRATKEDVERAVVSAEKGQKIWAAMTSMERSRILRRAVDILRERNDELAALETLDTGKSYSETRYVDIVTGADPVLASTRLGRILFWLVAFTMLYILLVFAFWGLFIY